MTTAILADIGGTNVRFATRTASGALTAREQWLADERSNFAAALTQYIELTGAKDITTVAVCAAGPLIRERIKMTNIGWTLDRAELETKFKTRVVLLNDFAALAHGVPTVGPDDCRHLGGGAPDPAGQRLIIGPGTGLGVASLTPLAENKWKVMGGEGGYVTLAPHDAREIAVLYQLQQTFGHVAWEVVLSGPGLVNLMLAIAGIDGVGYKARPEPEDIPRMAKQGDPVAHEAMHLFAGWLGAAAGDAALITGATGGVFVAGGIVPQWGEQFDAAFFRRRFEAKGKMRDYLAPIPTSLVTTRDLAFRGLARALLG